MTADASKAGRFSVSETQVSRWSRRGGKQVRHCPDLRRAVMSSRPQSLISAVNRYRLEGEQVAQILEPRVEMASMMDALAPAAYPRRRLGRRLTLTRGAQVQIRLKAHTRCREPTDRSASSAVDEGLLDNDGDACAASSSCTAS